MNTKPTSQVIARCLGVLACAAICVSAAACSPSEPAEIDTATQSSSAESEVALVPQLDNYSLSYSSDCGDGPFYTQGTNIEVVDGVVSVLSGEEPFSVGSLAVWNDIAQAAAADGRPPGIELSPDGSLKSLEISGRGIDDEFCVTVLAFEDLS